MPELDVALRELGRQIEFPPTPDLASSVRSRLERRRRWLRPAAIALAILVVAIGAALVVPPARTAILDWLGLRGVSIVRVDELPATPPIGQLDLGRRITLEEAPPWALVPDDEPDSVFVEDGTVNLLWGTPDDVQLLLTEFRGDAFIEKLIRDPEFSYAPEPENVMKIYGFMNRVGALKNMPATWQDLFFPEAHGLKGN